MEWISCCHQGEKVCERDFFLPNLLILGRWLRSKRLRVNIISQAVFYYEGIDKEDMYVMVQKTIFGIWVSSGCSEAELIKLVFIMKGCVEG